MAVTEITVAQPDWGIAFPRRIASAGGLDLLTMPAPKRVTVSLHQNIGYPASPCVTPGEQVAKGQPVGHHSSVGLSATVHAPISGQVSAIAEFAVPGQAAQLCVVIESDGRDQEAPSYRPLEQPLQKSPAELLVALSDAGIVGLGGAQFPADAKLASGSDIDTLILNGVECEPRINCDDALMRHRGDELLDGARLMLHITGARECIIALKSDTQAAIEQLRGALEHMQDSRLRLALVPPVYPAGGEEQLVQMLTGREIPSGGLPRDIGALCQNVGTAAAMSRFFRMGEPLISRIVTVTGSGVRQPVNIESRIGTPLRDLIEMAGGYTTEQRQLVMGGPMMGIALPNDELPVTKATNCIYVQAVEELNPLPREMPCIRCNECGVVCPVALTPQLLLQAQRTDDSAKLQQLGLADCIECGCCDYVCPSHIPLTQNFVAAKRANDIRELEHERAIKSRRRFEARSERLAQETAERDQELAGQIDALGPTSKPDKSALDELMQRVQKSSQQQGNAETDDKGINK